VAESAPYEILSLDDLERYPAMSGAPILMPLRRRLGFRPFGLNCWTAEVGEPVIERHFERGGDEELYVVVRGRASFTVGDETVDAGPGTLVHALPGTLREAIATEPDTLVLAAGATIGEAYEPKPWEDFQIAFAQARAGGVDQARTLIGETVARHPDAWQGYYNAACFEALQQNADAAFVHLRRALDLAPAEVRKYADDDDLRGLRNDPRWQELFSDVGSTEAHGREARG